MSNAYSKSFLLLARVIRCLRLLLLLELLHDIVGRIENLAALLIDLGCLLDQGLNLSLLLLHLLVELEIHVIKVYKSWNILPF